MYWGIWGVGVGESIGIGFGFFVDDKFFGFRIFVDVGNGFFGIVFLVFFLLDFVEFNILFFGCGGMGGGIFFGCFMWM